MSIAAQTIITKGLSCGASAACEGGTVIITGPWNLFCLTEIPPPPPATSAGGRAMQPGEISQLYQPVPEEWQYIQVPRDKEAEYFRARKVVKIEFKLKNIHIEKEYSVPEEKARIIFNIANIYNVTRDRISATAAYVKRLYTKARVKVTGFRIKR